jgi:hypothetical protein
MRSDFSEPLAKHSLPQPKTMRKRASSNRRHALEVNGFYRTFVKRVRIDSARLTIAKHDMGGTSAPGVQIVHKRVGYVQIINPNRSCHDLQKSNWIMWDH